MAKKTMTQSSRYCMYCGIKQITEPHSSYKNQCFRCGVKSSLWLDFVPDIEWLRLANQVRGINPDSYPQLRKTYLCLRHWGKSHQQAISVLYAIKHTRAINHK